MVATGLFSLFGLIGVMNSDWNAFRVVLFIILMIHTFFSVRCFSALINPDDMRQVVIDVVLVFAYFLTGVFITSPLFYIGWVILFSAATLKYILLIGRLNQPHLLRRKLIADVSGLMLGCIALFTWASTEAFITVLFCFASGYYLLFNSLYVADEQV